jgi:AcrR family transcriptional regulator
MTETLAPSTAADPTPPPRRRTRLDPEARRALILDAAAQIVTTEGVSAVSMERLGREAGVSKALVYNYFPNRTDLLNALLMREVRLYQAEQRAAAQSARDEATLIRVTTRAYLDHVLRKGVLIQRLMNEPAIAESMSEFDKAARRDTIAYLAGRLNRDHSMPDEAARMLIELNLGLTGGGGDYLDRTGCDIEMMERMIVVMITANIAAVRAAFCKA